MVECKIWDDIYIEVYKWSDMLHLQKGYLAEMLKPIFEVNLYILMNLLGCSFVPFATIGKKIILQCY